MHIYTPRNVLITGGAGFIGCHFVRYLLGADPHVRLMNLDMLTYAGSLDNLKELPDPDRHTVVPGNICDRALVEYLLREHAIDTIVHFAAESHVDRSIRVLQRSSRPMWWAPSRCSRPPVLSGSTKKHGMRAAAGSTISPPMRSTVRWNPTIHLFARRRRMRPTPRMRRAKPPQIT